MAPSYVLLYGYAFWMFVLLMGIAVVRLSYVFSHKHAANTFKPFGEDVSEIAQRFCRAHANCYENFPMVIALVLVASMLNKLSVTDGWAIPFLFLRVLQSITHLISTSVLAVNIRFAFFVGQCAILVFWFYQLCPFSG